MNKDFTRVNRRSFLKAAGGGALLAGAGKAAQARPNLEPPADAVGMLYDSTLCIGCKACMAKCKEINGMPVDARDPASVWDAPVDLSGKTLNIIKVYRQGQATRKDQETDGYAFIKRHCMHCVDAGCVSACPVSAMRKDPRTGVVSHDKDACIGCRYCVYACPYNVPKFEIDEAFGQIQKCQFCNQAGVERLDRGLVPGCVEVCPTGASLFGTRKEMLAEARRRLALQPGQSYDYPRLTLDAGDTHRAAAPDYQPTVYGEKEGGGTQVLHISAVPSNKLGLPAVPERSYASLSESIQHGIYSNAILPLAVFGGLLFAARRSTRALDEQASDEQHGE